MIRIKIRIPTLLLISSLLCTGCGTDDTPSNDRANATATADNSTPSDGSRPSDPRDNPSATTAPATTRAATSPATGPSSSMEPPAKLYGTWVANNVKAPFGEVKIELTMRKEGPLKLLAWSELPFVGQVKDLTAPFEVTDHTLHSDAIRGGTSVKYRFDGEDLIIEYQDGSTVRFHRQ